MGEKLVSKPDVMSSTSIMYPDVSKNISTQLTRRSATKILSIN